MRSSRVVANIDWRFRRGDVFPAARIAGTGTEKSELLGLIEDLAAAASGGARLVLSPLAQLHQGRPIGSLWNFKGGTEQVY
jgi:hypothetical protein